VRHRRHGAPQTAGRVPYLRRRQGAALVLSAGHLRARFGPAGMLPEPKNSFYSEFRSEKFSGTPATVSGGWCREEGQPR
jgi:hypothetical protein